MLGQIVGNFRVVAQLGRGGMGEVYRGEQVSVGTQVAIKVLSAELSADNDYVQRLFNEARAVSRIRHPGVVQIFDVGRDANGRAYLIMELLHGESLRQALVRGRFPATMIAELGKQITSVLEATHAVGIIHRDLKPDNVFLVPDPHVTGGLRVKVLDFGIAKLAGTLHAVSPQTHGAMGTPAYMAPEQWDDPTKIDGRVDLYALGCVLFEMATGRPPFLVTTMAEACKKHLNEAPPRARSLAPDVPESLDTLIDRLLAKQPAYRAGTHDVIATLDALARGHAPTAISQTQPTQLPMPAPKRSSKGLWAVAAIVAALAAIGVIAFVVAKKSAPPASAGSKESAPPASAGNKQPAPPDIPLQRPVAEDQFLQWLAENNNWFVEGDVPVQYFAVRKKEYKRYLALLAPKDAAWAKPLFDTAIDGEDSAQNWVTWEQADRYCKFIGGKLLTSERWQQLGAGESGINTNGVRYWTSTKTPEGKAIVRGAFTELPMTDPTNQKPWLYQWDTEASAHGRDPIEKVSSRQIGFRCTR